MNKLILSTTLALVLAFGVLALAPTQAPEDTPNTVQNVLTAAGPDRAEAHGYGVQVWNFCNHRDVWRYDHFIDVRGWYIDRYGNHRHWGYVTHYPRNKNNPYYYNNRCGRH